MVAEGMVVQRKRKDNAIGRSSHSHFLTTLKGNGDQKQPAPPTLTLRAESIWRGLTLLPRWTASLLIVEQLTLGMPVGRNACAFGCRFNEQVTVLAV